MSPDELMPDSAADNPLGSPAQRATLLHFLQEHLQPIQQGSL